jgi:hypothetical protein
MNRSWYHHEPQLEKFKIRVNHNLEPRRPNKIYRGGSENLNGHTTCVYPFLGGKTKSQLGRFVVTISRTLEGIESIANMDNPRE